MGNHCVDTHSRTKCSGSRFQCLLWIYAALVCLCIVPICVAEGEQKSVSMYPEGDSYVRYGENLTIYCIAGPGHTWQDLKITHSGKKLKTTAINESTIMFMETPKEYVREIYYCKNTKTNENIVKTVLVASPPKNVTDFKCISMNFEVLNCSWTSPDLIIFTEYKLTLKVSNGAEIKPCVPNQIGKTLLRYCFWNTTSQPRYRQQEAEFNFTLVSQNVFGNNTQEFTIDHFSIVKPDPPMNLTNVTETPHSVLLSWQLPNNVFDFLDGGVDHKIEYQIAKIDDKKFFRYVNTSELPAKPNNKNSYKFNLTLPYAHMLYGVRVYIKPKAAKSEAFWSDFSRVVFYTSSERPNRPPDMIAGAFDQNQFQGRRLLYVYWKQLEEYEEAGANFTYKIIVSRESSAPKTYWPDKNKSLGYLYLEDESMEALHVAVQAYNEKGTSVNSSYLHIPPEKETRSLRLTLFTKLAYENGTYELSWAGIANIDNYTLFWCHHNTTNICSGRINFTVLNPNMNKHIINLPRDYRYQFAISANKGHRTSGMVWAKCDISKDGIAMFDFPIRFIDHDAPGTTFVKLKWSMDCTLKEGIINGYNISYCPVIGTSVLCDNSFGSLDPYIMNDPKQMEVTVTGLRPYTTYQFTMALNTTYGLKTIENTTVRITTLEDTPTKPLNVKITQVNITSLNISWDPPLHLNGHVSKIKYVIYNFGKTFIEFKYEENRKHSKSRWHETLNDLNAFTNYSLTMSACNEGIVACSDPTDPIFIRTKIGSPSKLEPPSYKNNYLSWNSPAIPGGTVDSYQIRIVKDATYEDLKNSSDSNYYVISCEGAVQNVTYQVRAVNIDRDQYHGVLTDSQNVTLDERDENDNNTLLYFGDWSNETAVLCTSRDNLFLLYIIICVLGFVGAGCGVLKTYKKIKKMGDIKPEFPKGLFVPEKEITKYPFNGLYPTEKDEKPMSDEMLLLPNSKSTVSSPEIKNADTNCAASDHTDSTALSDASHGPIERQNSTSDDGSQSSLRLEVEPGKEENTNADKEEPTSSNAESSSSGENSPYFGDSAFKKNMVTGYVQPVVSPATGYVQTVPTPFKAVPQKPPQPTTSSYVMAGLSPPIFSTGANPLGGSSQPQPSSGYVRAEDVQARAALQFPKLGTSVSDAFGSESLPTMPTLPTPTKYGADSSYIQLQSLDSLPSHKPNVRTVPLKPPASSGYVSPGDAVINKHLSNIMSGTQPEESAILDPAMSPDAYCRFSWSTDPSNDNLHSLLANSSTTNPSKN